ncbi:MAG TPA: hypothetical protein VGA85_05935 [Dehalococcoidales bacterium]
MDDKRSLYREHYSFFVTGFFAIFSISLAVYAIYVSGGGEAMTQPLPPLVWIGIIISGIFAILAIYNGIKMITTPKDNRLNELIQVVKDLKPSKDLTNIPDLKSITTQIDELKKLQTDLNDFFEHLPQKDVDTTKKK